MLKSEKNSNVENIKSEFLKSLVSKKNENEMAKTTGIKDLSVLDFSEVVNHILSNGSDKELNEICSDINSGRVRVGMDSKSVNLISKNSDNENLKKLLQNINISMNIDINSISELSSKQFESMKNMGCKINKVFVNSGYDEAAKRGYSEGVYKKIIGKAEKMVDSAFKNLPEDANEETKFMALYNIVLKNTTYDYDTLDKKRGKNQNRFEDSSRNLEGWFVDDCSLCAGTADALVQLCKLKGIEAEYVQGQANGLHAWVKVKIDDKWYNADPTWDANKTGKAYEYCLKSDKDFKNHKEQNYNPSYFRNTNGKNVKFETKNIHEANYSKTRYDLKHKYYSDDLQNRKVFYRDLTEAEIKESYEKQRPITGSQVATMNKPDTLLGLIIEFLSKLLGAPKKIFKNAFKDNKRANKIDLSKMTSKDSAENYIKSQVKENDGFAGIKVDEKTANAYIDNKSIKKAKGKNKVEDKQK